MTEQLSTISTAFSSHLLLIIVASLGGFVLAGLKIAEHFSKDEKDKLSAGKYCGFFIFIILGLPFLGALVTFIYLLNGDKISTILAFQIGLTSPAIVQSLIIAAANTMASKTRPQLEGQQ